MTPLLTNQKVLIWLCAHRANEIQNESHRTRYTAFTVFVFTSHLCFLIPSIAYLERVITTDLYEALYVLIQIFAILPMIKALIIMISLRKRFTELFKKLSAIYVASKTFMIYFVLMCDFI